MSEARLSTGVDERTFGRAPHAPGGAGGPATYELASWGVRAAAFALDMLVAAGVGVVLAIGVIVAEGDTENARRLAQTLTYAIGIPLGLLYAPLLMLRSGERNGQTLGKQAMRIRVVREDGAPMGLGTGLLREVVGRQLPAALTSGIYAVFDYLWPLWDTPRQCLHDKVARTRVVRADAPSAFPAFSAAPLPPPAEPADERPVREGWLPPAAGR